MPAHTEHPHAFPPQYLTHLQAGIRASRYFTTSTLNRDFVGTRGFSVAFRREALGEVVRAFPFFAPFLERALLPHANAFYLNPLELQRGSRVDPHIDRSLRAYCPRVVTPQVVTVLYIEVPPSLEGGDLVLERRKKHVGRIHPEVNKLVTFQGDLTHSIERLESPGVRLSLVCEQYELLPEELEQVPSYTVESRARTY